MGSESIKQPENGQAGVHQTAFLTRRLSLVFFAELFPTGVARRIRMYPRDSTSSFLCLRSVEGACYGGFERWLLIDIGTDFWRQTSMKNMSWSKLGTEALFSAFVVFPDSFGTISLVQSIDGAAHPWFQYPVTEFHHTALPASCHLCKGPNDRLTHQAFMPEKLESPCRSHCFDVAMESISYRTLILSRCRMCYPSSSSS